MRLQTLSSYSHWCLGVAGVILENRVEWINQSLQVKAPRGLKTWTGSD